jgi:mono/diheme cytochrome c family protein
MNTNLRIFRIVSLKTLAVACLLALAVSTAFGKHEKPQNGKLVYAALAEVPGKAQAKQNPLENDPDATVAGGKLFEEHCAECHGMKAEGTRRGPSLLKEQVRLATPGALFWILSNGVIRRGMPDWSKLPEPQRWQLVRYIKSLGVSAQDRGQADPKR